MVEVDSRTPRHLEYHCSNCGWDTDSKSEWFEHISNEFHPEYGHIPCSICGKQYVVPKDKPIAAVLFRRNPATGGTAAAHPECMKAAGLIP